MLKRIPGLLFLLLAAATSADASTIQLPRSGQTSCYDSAGTVIACTGTGQDAAWLAGAPWPSPRFTDNADGTVTDNLTSLVWLKDAECLAGFNWPGALMVVNALANGTCGLEDGSIAGAWRLPNRTEMLSLRDSQTRDPALPGGYPFKNIVDTLEFWTSTTMAGSTWPEFAYFVTIQDGFDHHHSKIDHSNWGNMLPVRGTSATLPRTGQSDCIAADGTTVACAGTGQDGDLRSGVAWPSPRFIDNGNLTVTDDLTGLIWLKNADCFGASFHWLGALTVVNVLANGDCGGLSDGSHAGDWRLPNLVEQSSLLDMRNSGNIALPEGHPFTSVNATDAYATSTTDVNLNGGNLPIYAALVYIASDVDSYNTVISDLKDTDNSMRIWPVRGGLFGHSVIAVTPSSNDYGTVALGNSSPLTFTISNGSAATSKLQVNAIVLSGTDADAGHYQLTKGNGTGGTCGPTPILAPGESCTLTVAFTPTTPMIKSANLRVSASDIVTPNTNIALVGNKPVDGVCGSSDKSTFTVMPAANFCSAGTATALTGTGPWNWSCTGLNGGSDATCSAAIQTYTVTFAAGANGTLSGSTSQTVKYGNNATTVTANPAIGYHFVNWTGTYTSSANPLTIASVTQAVSLTANFAVGSPVPNGDCTKDGKVDIADALMALRIAVVLIPMDAKYLADGDVAPFNGVKPQPNGIIDNDDALVILKKCVGLINW